MHEIPTLSRPQMKRPIYQRIYQTVAHTKEEDNVL